MVTPVRILENVGTITKVPNKILIELTKLTNLCIASAISDAKLQEQSTLTVDIGIGVLGIDLINMDCKFVPSKELKQSIKTAISTKNDPLALEIEQTMINKLISLCEEVI